MSHLPLGTIRHILAQNFQIRRDTKEKPATIRILECTQRLHTLNKFACGLFQLQYAALVLCNEFLYFVYTINIHERKFFFLIRVYHLLIIAFSPIFVFANFPNSLAR